MKNKFLFTVAPFAALLLSEAALAANTANVSVSGELVPAICDISLTGGGRIDYGVMPMTSLTAASNTVVTPGMSGTHPTTTMNIVCEAPVQFSVKVNDNRAATVNADVLNGTAGTSALPVTTGQIFGVGADSAGTNIGAFSIMGAAAGATVDGAAGKVIDSLDGTLWTNSNGQFSNVRNWALSWTSAAGTNAPEPVTTVVQELEVQVAVIPSADLDTSRAVNLDGSVTLEVQYL
jgi:hypothetical protein